MKTTARANDGKYTCDENQETVVDRHLFKAIGLNKLLRLQVPSGVFVRTYWIFVLTAACLNLGVLPMQTVRMYLELHNLQTLLPAAVFVAITLNSIFKGYVMVMNADGFRALLEVTLHGFTASGRANPSVLLRCRNTLSAYLRAYVVYNFVSFIVWTVSSWFINDQLPYVKLDGTVGSYRATVLNWWYPVSEAAFNRTPVWAVIWAIETIVCSINVYCWVLFECSVVCICMAMSAQFQTVSAACESLGRNSSSSTSSRRGKNAAD